MFIQSTVDRNTFHNVWDFESIENIAVSYSYAQNMKNIIISSSKFQCENILPSQTAQC